MPVDTAMPVELMAETTMVRDLVFTAEEAGQRLDKMLSQRVPELSRSRVRALIEAGHVHAGEASIGDPNHRVKPVTVYRVVVPPPQAASPLPEPIALTVVHEDRHLIVIDKPAGLVVHPAAGHPTGTLVNALMAHCGDSLSGIGGVRRPGIVHRLDKDTSGLLVVAKTDAAHRSLSEQFASHGRDGRLHRAYLALVWGQPLPKAGRIDAALGRKASNRTKIAVIRQTESDGDGEPGIGGLSRHAVTHYAVLAALPPIQGPGPDRDQARGQKGAVKPAASLIRCILETGRTHQIRVHLAHIGHPLLGDATYGTGFLSSARKLSEAAQAALTALGRQALHAAELSFEHPSSGKTMQFKSELPADMALVLASLRT